MEKEATIPIKIKKWNWGAMLLSPLWCLRHGVWQGFLLLVPLLGLFMPFVLGAYGNRWAWRKEQGTQDQFLRRQRFWAIAGSSAWVFFFGIFFCALFFGLNHSKGITRALEISNANSRLVNYLGSPIKKSSLFAGTNISNSHEQFVRFPVKGSQEEGTLECLFEKVGDNWLLRSLALTKKDGSKLDVVDSTTIETSFSDSPSENIDELPAFIDRLEEEQTGFIILTRNTESNDLLQTAIVFDDEENMGFEVIYSDGYTRENKQVYKTKKLIFDKNQLIELFRNYANGTDLHVKEMEWAKLIEIQESDLEGIGTFIFES